MTPGRAAGFVGGEEAAAVLGQCVERNAFVQLYFPGNNYACGATFWGATENRLTVMLDADVDPAMLAIFGLCSVYFIDDNLAHLGLGRLLNVEKGPQNLFQAEFERPQTFSTSEPRTSVRVAVPPDCGMVAFVFDGGDLIRAKPINVSLGGMLIELPQPLAGVEVGSVIQVQASWKGTSLNLPALVRWHESTSYGLFFNTVASYGQPSSCPELVAFVQGLLELQATKKAA